MKNYTMIEGSPSPDLLPGFGCLELDSILPTYLQHAFNMDLSHTVAGIVPMVK